MTCQYPLEWPQGWARTPTADRRVDRANKLAFDKIMDKLYYELERLRAESIVISSWVPLTSRGLPMAAVARRTLEDPGVALYFSRHGKPLVMARDAFDNACDNINSLRHAVTHLRGLERHGGGLIMDRAFDGFLKLPAPGKAGWQAVLGQQSTLGEAEAIYKEKQRALHRNHGISDAEREEAAVKLNLAIEECRQFFGGKAA